MQKTHRAKAFDSAALGAPVRCNCHLDAFREHIQMLTLSQGLIQGVDTYSPFHWSLRYLVVLMVTGPMALFKNHPSRPVTSVATTDRKSQFEWAKFPWRRLVLAAVVALISWAFGVPVRLSTCFLVTEANHSRLNRSSTKTPSSSRRPFTSH